jgi:hypothetical protein
MIFGYCAIHLSMEAQEVLFPEALPKIKGECVIPALMTDREFRYKGVTYSFVGFKPVLPTHGYQFPSGRFYVGKFAKLKKQQIGEKIPGDIVDVEHNNWITVLLIFDVVTLHIFASKDWRFGQPEQICRSLQQGLGEVTLSKYNHKIFIEGKTQKEIFWNIVHVKKKVYKLEFKLISPNILDTNQKARDALKALKEIFEQEEIDITLKNDSGDLKVPEEPVSSYLEYITEGEGAWKITTEGDRGGKKTHSSSENIDTISLPELGSKSEVNNQLQLLDGNELPKRQGFSEARLGAEVYAAINNMEKN